MNYIAILLCCASTALASTSEWRPPDEFLKAIRQVESSNGANKVGDNGDSLGEFQLSEAAWLDVNGWRKTRALKTYPYDRTVFHSYISRVYASNYLTILYDELNRKLHRAPTPAELYAAYNLGLSSFAQCDYKLKRVNPTTRARCEQITVLMEQNNSP
jgi:hypothetical protein